MRLGQPSQIVSGVVVALALSQSASFSPWMPSKYTSPSSRHMTPLGVSGEGVIASWIADSQTLLETGALADPTGGKDVWLSEVGQVVASETTNLVAEATYSNEIVMTTASPPALALFVGGVFFLGAAGFFLTQMGPPKEPTPPPRTFENGGLSMAMARDSNAEKATEASKTTAAIIDAAEAGIAKLQAKKEEEKQISQVLEEQESKSEIDASEKGLQQSEVEKEELEIKAKEEEMQQQQVEQEKTEDIQRQITEKEEAEQRQQELERQGKEREMQEELADLQGKMKEKEEELQKLVLENEERIKLEKEANLKKAEEEAEKMAEQARLQKEAEEVEAMEFATTSGESDYWSKEASSAMKAFSNNERGPLRSIVANLVGTVRSTKSSLQKEEGLRKEAETNLKIAGEKFQDLEDQFELGQTELQKTQSKLQETETKLTSSEGQLSSTRRELTVLQDERRSLRKLGRAAWRLSKERLGKRVQKVKSKLQRPPEEDESTGDSRSTTSLDVSDSAFE